ncbi:MAG: hypothetical protein QNJ60_14945 [Xenococcaceae cyanobacterium MO_188.B19]|nr:hypothetical protein [Xenococcaceae cyanobacterium MO_188.B19]
MTGITKEEMRRKLGNITQLRELLFGEQIEEYERKFDQSFQHLNQLSTEVKQLEGKFIEFRADMRQQLHNLENNLSREISSAVDSLEKKIQYLNLNTRSETKRLHQEIQEVAQSTDQSIEEVTDNLKSQTKYLKDELSQTRNDLEKESQSLKQQLTEKIEKNLVELTDGKVSRTDLAEVLFELCLKIKGTNMVSEAQENGGEKIATELLLPNEKIKA